LTSIEQSGNNVDVPDGKTPMYNTAWGFENGMLYFFLSRSIAAREEIANSVFIP
jgi:hypothetical protein